MILGSVIMLKIPTSELMEKLLKANNISDYIKENEDFFIDLTISDFLNEYAKAKKLTKSKVIKDAQINEIYGYQIFSGSRIPSRNKLLALCIAMEMSLYEVQLTLKTSGFATLYPKNKWDSIVIRGIADGYNVLKINNDLYENGEKTLD